ncbi:LeuD/DmdB family oxidoreductase small subunit [Peristeroidobacter soli]|uniref:LeuD/DmdB family oxidoreductase small subunit n=1 Tax=Peristeroidobacter soli TaxID=2497877 RepID=UPI00101BEB0C|nr:3-isopropylmalate dehydratase [Peristeroidobacter soli]
MIRGKVWTFGDNINTDLMVPSEVTYASPEAQARAVFQANRPGWVNEVQRGDVLIGGRNFGMGSSRPAARSLKNVGLSCMLAESLNGLFFRNAVNFGFVAMECPGIHELFAEGQVAQVDIDNWLVTNEQTGTSLPITPIPVELRSLMMEGGVFSLLEKLGLIEPGKAKAKQ